MYHNPYSFDKPEDPCTVYLRRCAKQLAARPPASRSLNKCTYLMPKSCIPEEYIALSGSISEDIVYTIRDNRIDYRYRRA